MPPRQREQSELEIRVGPGEYEGRRGLRALRLNVDPNVALWFQDLAPDPLFPVDPRLGSFHVYVNGELRTSIVAGDLPPASVSPPGDLARVEQLRTDIAKLEARQVAMTAQAGVDEHRLKTIQAELVACEARISLERERVVLACKAADEEIDQKRKSAAEEKKQQMEDLRLFREAMMAARQDSANMFENLRTAEIEEARMIAKRRQKAQEQLTSVVEEFSGLETNALRNTLASGARPSTADQAAKMGINVSTIVDGACKVIDRVRGEKSE